MSYLWIKSFHVIAMVAWFAALFYLPRLYVYHAMTEDQSGKDRFKIMERKLYNGIMLPASIATLFLGLWLLHLNAGLYHTGWMHVKLSLVALLYLYQFYLNQIRKTFSQDKNQRSHVFYRWLNEAPTLLLIAIVILAEVKPF